MFPVVNYLYVLSMTCPKASSPSPRNTTRSPTAPAIRKVCPATSFEPAGSDGSIVDVFSALTDRRVYKPPMDAETALNLMVSIWLRDWISSCSACSARCCSMRRYPFDLQGRRKAALPRSSRTGHSTDVRNPIE